MGLRPCPDLIPGRHGARDLQSVASGSSAGGFDLTGSSFVSKGSAGSATPYSLGSLTDTPAAQTYAGQLSFNQKPFNQMYKVHATPWMTLAVGSGLCVGVFDRTPTLWQPALHSHQTFSPCQVCAMVRYYEDCGQCPETARHAHYLVCPHLLVAGPAAPARADSCAQVRRNVGPCRSADSLCPVLRDPACARRRGAASHVRRLQVMHTVCLRCSAHQHGPNSFAYVERSRPAEAHGIEPSKKRVREEPPDTEPCDDNQFGMSPKQAKVKKALIVSGGLCGFKARHQNPDADVPLQQRWPRCRHNTVNMRVLGLWVLASRTN